MGAGFSVEREWDFSFVSACHSRDAIDADAMSWREEGKKGGKAARARRQNITDRRRLKAAAAAADREENAAAFARSLAVARPALCSIAPQTMRSYGARLDVPHGVKGKGKEGVVSSWMERGKERKKRARVKQEREREKNVEKKTSSYTQKKKKKKLNAMDIRAKQTGTLLSLFDLCFPAGASSAFAGSLSFTRNKHSRRRR
jgi:hypothetical protein